MPSHGTSLNGRYWLLWGITGVEYSYEPLTGSDIRVATLQPGSSAGRISISLRHVGPRDEPMYEALSYTWGDPKDVCSLECDRGRLTVTRNLYRALLRLRDEHNPRTLWIDAVCIPSRVSRGFAADDCAQVSTSYASTRMIYPKGIIRFS
jgi:hypothetical protein